MAYPEPYIPRDWLTAVSVVAGVLYAAAFWAAAIYWGIAAATDRPAACANLTAAECSAAVTEGR